MWRTGRAARQRSRRNAHEEARDDISVATMLAMICFAHVLSPPGHPRHRRRVPRPWPTASRPKSSDRGTVPRSRHARQPEACQTAPRRMGNASSNGRQSTIDIEQPGLSTWPRREDGRSDGGAGAMRRKSGADPPFILEGSRCFAHAIRAARHRCRTRRAGRLRLVIRQDLDGSALHVFHRRSRDRR